MKIVVVGSGAREHAIAWKTAASPRVSALYCAPGNAGTAKVATNVAIAADAIDDLVEFIQKEGVDMVVVGPEVALSLGLCDKIAQRCSGAGTICFGPSRAAAQLESSKAFAKNFMKRQGIPTADFRIFTSFEKARDFIADAPWPFVIKASGLASGKGVFLPGSPEEAAGILASLLRDRKMGEAGGEVVIEERLQGEEISLLAFCDGRHISVMPPSQDHKRLLDADEGPNTGGMGAIASGPHRHSAAVKEMAAQFLQKACDGLRSEGREYRGVLYAGLILTPQGPKALEYNCRFGDPEAEAILPLLKTDIVDIFEACAHGQLDSLPIEWEEKYSACVVIASRGYATDMPQQDSREVVDHNSPCPDEIIFHAATRIRSGKVIAQGGRLLCASAWADTLDAAIAKAYSLVTRIDIAESQYRHDIGAGKNFLRRSPEAYSRAGVDIAAGDKAVELMTAAVKSTYGKEVLAGIGSFGGMYDIEGLKSMRHPVLVASTDGVGTKVKLAAQSGRYAGVGRDLVNHCIDDILVQGARPLFFLDYFATSRLKPAIVAEVVSGMAEACKASECALIGGETAEMPGVYLPDEFDIAGTIVGVVEKDQRLPEDILCAGDLIIGLASNGLHTNGYSLARKIFGEKEIAEYSQALGMPVIEALLACHRSYLPVVWPILRDKPGMIKALAHITGGGFEGNIPRVLPSDLDAHIRCGSWPVPPIFTLIMERGRVDAAEMHRVFNMGIGMTAIIAEADREDFMRRTGETCYVIGSLAAGKGEVIMEGIEK
ncbi:MAG: phosphoribosylamine--glycine ligase [Spirochaetaceae bacterium]|nr:phosphoribosylamine--glycine ligase [Spirochaetaceae bacterium]